MVSISQYQQLQKGKTEIPSTYKWTYLVLMQRFNGGMRSLSVLSFWAATETAASGSVKRHRSLYYRLITNS